MSRKILAPYLVVALALLWAPLAGSSGGSVSDVGPPPPASSSGGTLTGTYNDPTGNYLPPSDYLKFTITGADLKLKPGTPASYVGTATGSTITLSGTMSVTRSAGYSSNVNMVAFIGDQRWQWPAKGGSETVTGRSVTQSFNLTFKVGTAKTPTVTGGATLGVCAGICSPLGVDFTIGVKSGSKPTTTTTTTATPPKGVPTVEVFAPAKNIRNTQSSGTYWKLEVAPRDASGKATVYGALYEGGDAIRHVKGTGPADGRHWSWQVLLPADSAGPMYWCAYAVNADNQKSVDQPYSSCVFIPVAVPVKRVSNGCGGNGWDALVWLENYFGNVHTYLDGTKTYTVDFTDACDLHDAGYAGVVVADKINGGVRDMHTWPRTRVDETFWANMKTLCNDQIMEQAPEGVMPSTALAKCRSTGGHASIGSQWLYKAVLCAGNQFFDADLTVPGIQDAGRPYKPRPRLGIRNNTAPPFGSTAKCVLAWGLGA